MKTCKYFAPSKETVDSIKSQMPVDYEFDGNFNYPACTCKQVVGSGGFGVCSYYPNFARCRSYEEDTPRILQSVKVLNSKSKSPYETEKVLTLESSRVGVEALPEYDIKSRQLNDPSTGTFTEPVTLHHITREDHPDTTELVATKLYEVECAQATSVLPFELDDVNSYMEAVCD